MCRIAAGIQGQYLRRQGLRGRFPTRYGHEYPGQAEVTEHFQVHPGPLSFGVA